MDTSSKKRFWLPTSLIWLPIGFMFFGLTLFFAHLNQTRAVSEPEMTAASAQPASGFQRTVDPQFPGSVPYVALRVNDRLQALSLRAEELPAVYLQRSLSRLRSAQYAWQHNDHAQAVTTLHKSHVYLSKSLSACQDLPTQTPACQHLATAAPQVQADILALLSEFLSQPCSEPVAQSLQGLQEQVRALSMR